MANSIQNASTSVIRMDVAPDDRCPICFETQAENIEAVWVGHKNPTHFYHANCAYRWTLRDVTQLSRCPSLPCEHNLDSASLRPFISKEIINKEQTDQLKDLARENAPSLIANSMQLAGLFSIGCNMLSTHMNQLNKKPYLLVDLKVCIILITLHSMSAIMNTRLPNTLSTSKKYNIIIFTNINILFFSFSFN